MRERFCEKCRSWTNGCGECRCPVPKNESSGRVRKLVRAARAWLDEADRLGIKREDFKGPAEQLWDAAQEFRPAPASEKKKATTL